MRLAWRDRSTNETGFEIQRALAEDDDDAFTRIVILSAGRTSYTDIDLPDDTCFRYRIRALRGDT